MVSWSILEEREREGIYTFSCFFISPWVNLDKCCPHTDNPHCFFHSPPKKIKKIPKLLRRCWEYKYVGTSSVSPSIVAQKQRFKVSPAPLHWSVILGHTSRKFSHHHHHHSPRSSSSLSSETQTSSLPSSSSHPNRHPPHQSTSDSSSDP